MERSIKCTGPQCVRKKLAGWVKYYQTETKAYRELVGMPHNRVEDAVGHREEAVLQRLRRLAVSQLGRTLRPACNHVGNCRGVSPCGELLPKDRVFTRSWFETVGEGRGKPPENIGEVPLG